jgi:hypothetical protein
MDSKRYTRQDIDKMTFHVSSLDQGQRQRVRDLLYRLHDQNDGVLYKEETHRELWAMREANDISETDFHAVLKAFFG